MHAWTDADVGWDEADLVVVTTTWDYTLRQAHFLDWVRSRTSPVLNDPALLVWNCDKHYLADLASAGIPTVPTSFVSPGEPLRPLVGEVVVKPTVSAGARDTGRSAEDIALGYKNLLEAERGFRDMKSTLQLRPVFHRLEPRIRAHVLLCWLALLLVRVAERRTGRGTVALIDRGPCRRVITGGGGQIATWRSPNACASRNAGVASVPSS